MNLLIEITPENDGDPDGRDQKQHRLENQQQRQPHLAEGQSHAVEKTAGLVVKAQNDQRNIDPGEPTERSGNQPVADNSRKNRNKQPGERQGERNGDEMAAARPRDGAHHRKRDEQEQAEQDPFGPTQHSNHHA